MKTTQTTFDPTQLIVAHDSNDAPRSSEVLGRLVGGSRETREAALATLQVGLEILESASHFSRGGMRRLPKLDAQTLFRLRNVRRSFVQILDALGEGETMSAEQVDRVGEQLGVTGQIDNQRIHAEGAELYQQIASIDAGTEREAAVLNDALTILVGASAELHVEPTALLERAPVREQFLQLLQSIPEQSWFGKDVGIPTRSVRDYLDGNEPKKTEAHFKRDFFSEQREALLRAAYTVDEPTPFASAAGKTFRTAGGHTAHVWSFGIQDGDVILKGTVEGAGTSAWDVQGRDLDGDARYDLKP